MRVLIRVGYGLASILVFGAMALSTEGGRYRLGLVVLGVLIGVVLFATGEDTEGASLRSRFALRSRMPATPDRDREAPPAEG